MFSTTLQKSSNSPGDGRLWAVRLIVAIAVCSLSSLSLAQRTPPLESVATDQTNLPDVVVYPGPPSGFDPLTASDEALAHYGIPPRPDAQSAPEAYAAWRRMVTGPQKRITNPKLQQTTISNGPARNVSLGETLENGIVKGTSSNWSGSVVTGPTGMLKVNNSYVFAQWVVPSAQQAYGVCTGRWDYSSQWVGIDGWSNNDVLQAGTEADAYCSGSSTTAFYESWYEWYPYAETRITNFPTNPGDLISVDVWYTATTPLGHALLVNYSTNPKTTVNMGFNPPSGTTLDGNSVEWVVERPGLSGGTLADLTNYSAVPFNQAHARQGTSSNYYYPSSSPADTMIYNVTMTCPPWTPSSACTKTTGLSYADLYDTWTLWFYDENLAF